MVVVVVVVKVVKTNKSENSNFVTNISPHDLYHHTSGGGGGTVGQQAQIKDYNTQKKLFTEKIIYL